MNRMHDRMRVVFITIAVVCAYTVYFYTESRTTGIVARDRAAIDSAHNFDGDGGGDEVDDETSWFFGQTT
ncbi:hypothetical protein ANCDUO_25302 [Ancylostoma duodenale]|uniref:Uncharacterized protein n=1 Tax=Ancylostoma duodenale TaxID=51022 RepID=A0A0C2C4R9_9BILA|nr:hypothetical protein ANCDUO_25302 [Ancylostoma duodenale]